MLETIAIILLVLWLLGVVSGYTIGQLHLRTAGHRDRPLPGAPGHAADESSSGSADIRSFSASDHRHAREHDGAGHASS